MVKQVKYKNNFSFLLMLCLIILVSSCNKQVLRTTILNAPYVANLDKKYSAQATVQASFNHYEFQTAYALTNHIGVHTQFYLSSGYNINGGPVFYTNIKKLFYLESSFAFGKMNCYSKLENRSPFFSENADSWEVKTKANTYSGQLFGSFKIKNFTFGVGFKSTYFDFLHYEYNYFDAYYYSYGTINTKYIELVNNQYPQGWIFEPFAYLSINKGRIGFFLECGKANDNFFKINTITESPSTYPHAIKNTNNSIIFRNQYFNAGVVIKLDMSNRPILRGFFKDDVD